MQLYFTMFSHQLPDVASVCPKAQLLTVVVDGVGDDGVQCSGVVAVLVLQENLDAQADHVQVVFLRLQQLLPGHYGHTHEALLLT